jgi:hypothetical protein
MLQVFYLDVSKVDIEETHAAAASASLWVTVPLWVTSRACWCYCCVHADA